MGVGTEPIEEIFEPDEKDIVLNSRWDGKTVAILRYIAPNYVTAKRIPEQINGKNVSKINRISGENLKTTIIPETVQEIENATFANTPIVYAYLPKSLTTIEWGIFEGCDKLQTVYVYKGSVAEKYCIQSELPYSIVK